MQMNFQFLGEYLNICTPMLSASVVGICFSEELCQRYWPFCKTGMLLVLDVKNNGLEVLVYSYFFFLVKTATSVQYYLLCYPSELQSHFWILRGGYFLTVNSGEGKEREANVWISVRELTLDGTLLTWAYVDHACLPGPDTDSMRSGSTEEGLVTTTMTAVAWELVSLHSFLPGFFSSVLLYIFAFSLLTGIELRTSP